MSARVAAVASPVAVGRVVTAGVDDQGEGGQERPGMCAHGLRSSDGSGPGFNPITSWIAEIRRSGLGAGSEPTVQRGEADQLDAGMNAQLPVDSGAVRLDGLHADEQLVGDALVAVTGHDEIEDLSLARGELTEQPLGLDGLLSFADQLG